MLMRRLGAKTRTARPVADSVRVGALFFNDVKGDHYCTAGVVDSPHGDMLVTAAHCLYAQGAYVKDIVFVPAFRGGTTPYGVWTVSSMLVDDRWMKSSDPDMDVGFATVKPGSDNQGKTLQALLGANKLGINQGFDHLVEVTGYPSDSDQPVSCVNKTRRQSDHQLRFDCGHFFGGTSGAPWIADFDPHTNSGRIIGVIGGYETGGDTDAVSYSSYFGDAVQQLFTKAVAQES
jgi:V8-like Glu-specific endopeptidase